MTPQQELKFLRPAFLDLFNQEDPDLFRFLRLVADVLDTAAGYGPAKCAGGLECIGTGPGCGKTVTFKVASSRGVPYGYLCPECGTVYEWSMYKGPKSAPSRIVITSNGSTIGSTESRSDSGVYINDNGTVEMPQ